MEVSEKKHNVSGSWLGNYYYAIDSQPYGFEAVFVEQDGKVVGSILDDGKIGEAKVSGSFADPILTFTKIYNNPAHAPVRYEGTISDEGKRLTGTWQIMGEMHGSWMAWRQEEEEIPDLETEDESKDESELELVREKVMVRPRIQTQRERERRAE